MNDDIPPDLSHAGAIIDQAVAHMTERGLDGMAVASALLGATLAMLQRSMDDAGVVGVLERAIASVRRGELRS